MLACATRCAFAILALALTACAAPEARSPFPPDTGAIVELDLINHAACGRLPVLSGPSWTPEPEMIWPLEAALHDTLLVELPRNAEEFRVAERSPDSYYRRYAGVIAGAERRLIVICGEDREFYDSRGMDWRTQYIPYRYGGSMSFSAYYDPETDEILNFEFGYVG
ncbi:MAG: hypothetical protein R3C16_06745 [Hyphomonadaceae bacterium]